MWTTPAAFVDKTCLILDYHVGAILEATPHNLTPKQICWFSAHVDIRVRYMHAHNPEWRKWLENRNRWIDPRGQIQVWIRHWLAAYMQDPERYQAQHNADNLSPTA